MGGIQDDVIQSVLDAGQQVLGGDTAADVKKIEDQIVKLQEDVLELHKARQIAMVADDEYEVKVASYNDRMADLQAQLKQLKANATRHAEALHWLDSLRHHTECGTANNTNEAIAVREMVEQITVYDNLLEIQLKCGETIKKEIRVLCGKLSTAAEIRLSAA